MPRKPSLKQLYISHNGNVSDKWTLYLHEYQRLFSEYRNSTIRLLEIGVQNGGSLEAWAKYFSNAEHLVGCDINPLCKNISFADKRIKVIVCDANSVECKRQIIKESPTFTIIIDDGSHESGDIITTFGRYFSILEDGGVYIVEDLHASYWNDFNGGLHNPYSSISFFKKLLDIINYEHWRSSNTRIDILKEFTREYGQLFVDEDLAAIHSIEFVNSLCIIRKQLPENNYLGRRVVVGSTESVATQCHELDGTFASDIKANTSDDSRHVLNNLAERMSLRQRIVDERDAIIAELEKINSQCGLPAIELGKQIAQLIMTLDSVIAEAVVGNGESEQKQSTLEAMLVERDKHIANLSKTLDLVIADRDARAAGLEQMQSRFESILAERDKHIAHISSTLDSVIADRDARTAGLEQMQSRFESILVERDKHIAHLSNTLDSVIVDRDARAACLEKIQRSLENRKTISINRIIRNISFRKYYDMSINTIRKLINNISDKYEMKIWRYKSILRMLKEYLRDNDNPVPQDENNTRIVSGGENRMSKEVSEEKYVNVMLRSHTLSERILLVSYYCPSRAHAGGLRLLDIYDLIHKQCPNIQLDLFTCNRPDVDWVINDVYNIFDNVYLSPDDNLTPGMLAALSGRSLSYTLIDLQFHQCGYHIDEFRKISKRIIFTPMESLAKSLSIELHSLSFVDKIFPLKKRISSLRSAVDELSFMQKADQVVCVSLADAEYLRKVTTLRHIYGLETGVSQFEFSDELSSGYTIRPASSRPCRVLYVAYFGSETNVTALRWYLDNVHTLIKAAVPEYILTVVGRGDLSLFSDYRDSSVELVGEVQLLAPFIQDARVGIAPALGGSGFRGKINQYSVVGVPSVVSPAAYTGLLYTNDIDVFVAKSPHDFAEKCIRLLIDTDLNNRMGNAARKCCLDNYTWLSKWSDIKTIYQLESAIA